MIGDRSWRQLDLLIAPSARELIARSMRMGCGGRDVPVITLPDLIAMKRSSGRLADLADIDRLSTATVLSSIDLDVAFAEVDGSG